MAVASKKKRLTVKKGLVVRKKGGQPRERGHRGKKGLRDQPGRRQKSSAKGGDQKGSVSISGKKDK